MLTKLLKYELYTSRGALYAISGAMGGLLAVTCLVHLLGISVLNMPMVLFGAFASIAALMVCAVLLVLRTYARLCGRESTLTFTTPASVHEILLSNIFAAILLVGVTVIVIVAYWVLYALVCLDAGSRAAVLAVIREFGSEPLIDRVLTMVPVACLSYLCQLMLCAAIVNVPRFRNRNMGVASGIIAWIVLSQGYGLLMVGVWISYIISRGGVLDNAYLNDPANINWAIGSMFIIMTIGMAVAALIYYFVAARLLEKKRSL